MTLVSSSAASADDRDLARGRPGRGELYMDGGWRGDAGSRQIWCQRTRRRSDDGEFGRALVQEECLMSKRTTIQGVGGFWGARCLGVAVAGLTAVAVHGAPVVSSLNPVNGPPGTQVTVDGSGFTGAVQVQFNNTPADFQVQSGTRLIATVPLEATVGPVRVTAGGMTGDSGTKYFLPSPRFLLMSPTRGATNTTVVLEGENFLGATEVRFGDRPTVFTVTTPAQIRATVPYGVSNTVAVTVRTPAGVVTSSGFFTVTDRAPLLDGFVPPFGAPGTDVFIEGANFTNLTAVRFGGIPATVFNAPWPARITARVPAGAPTGPVTVVTTGGSISSSSNFVVTLAPIITNFNPRIGKPGQTQVILEGVNFAGVIGVGFNGRSVTAIGTPVPGQILVTVPSEATTGRISVTNQSGFGLSNTDFVIPKGPVIESFDPAIGRAGSGGQLGDPVTITGFNLSGAALRFNQTPASYTVVGQVPESIRATVPAGATTGPLSLSNSLGMSVTAENFTVVGDKPFIVALRPGHGPRGSTVHIDGRNFLPPVTVRFNGVQDPTAFAPTPGEIVATVPATATTGPLVVTTAAGSVTNALPFYLPPRLSSFAPASGAAGVTVTVNGLNLAAAERVEFGGVPAEFTVNAQTDVLVATVPVDGLSGLIGVVTPGGVVLSTQAFAVLPGISSFVPALGPNGTPVTIHGTGLHLATGVSFNHVQAAFQIVSATEIRTTVPTTATTGRIRVMSAAGTATSATDYRVTTSTDLRLSGGGSADWVGPGELVIYSLAVLNAGLSPATSVRLQQVFPAGLEFVSGSTSHGTHQFENGMWVCDLGVLTNGVTATLTNVMRAIAEGVWTNTATVTMAEADQNVGTTQCAPG
jgi:large repetitive protein